MDTEALTLWTIFDGWQGHQISLLKAIEPLTREQLLYRSAPELRTVGEIVNHIAGGRANWLMRIGEVGPEQARQVESWDDRDGVSEDATELVSRLEISWQLVEDKLKQWSVADLSHVYPLPYGGQTYAVSRQWVLWRIMAHDLHHGGEIALMLGEQGIAIPELGQEGGHITMPPLMQES
jgi:uncharacterized damage-inducible protein DinB